MAISDWEIKPDDRCKCCGAQAVSGWNKNAIEQALCDDCFSELFSPGDDDIIGYGKWE
jgi:hypothetical protein